MDSGKSAWGSPSHGCSFPTQEVSGLAQPPSGGVCRLPPHSAHPDSAAVLPGARQPSVNAGPEPVRGGLWVTSGPRRPRARITLRHPGVCRHCGGASRTPGERGVLSSPDEETHTPGLEAPCSGRGRAWNVLPAGGLVFLRTHFGPEFWASPEGWAGSGSKVGTS